MRRLMVTGSRARYWSDPTKVKRAITSRLSTYPLDWIVLEGEADGVDAWTKIACEITGHGYVPYPPDKSLPSPQRFHERNNRMLDDADEVLAFWDGESPGTKSVIRKARERGLRLWIVQP